MPSDAAPATRARPFRQLPTRLALAVVRRRASRFGLAGACLTLLLALACTAPPAPSTDLPGSGQPVAPIPSTSPSTEVEVVTVGLGREGAAAGVSRVTAVISPRSAAQPAVIIATPQFSTSPAARSSAWNAAAATVLMLGIDPGRVQFAYRFAGGADASGSSLALAVASLAAALGGVPGTTTVIIGKVLPDGTVGPASDLPARIDGAIASGATRLIVPALQLPANVDGLVKDASGRAAVRGLELVPVSTLAAAYQQATGRAAPLPASSGNPQADRVLTAIQSNLAAAWLARATAALERGRTTNLVATHRAEMEAAERGLAAGRRAFDDRTWGAALDAALGATLLVEGAEEQQRAVTTLRSRTFENAIAVVRSGDGLDLQLETTRLRLRSQDPGNVPDALVTLDAWRWFALADQTRIALTQTGEVLIQRERGLTRTQLEAEFRGLGQARASGRVQADMAAMLLDARPQPAPTQLIGAPSVAALGDLLRRAGDTSLAALDAEVIGPLADRRRTRAADIQAQLLAANADYTTTLASSTAAGRLAGEWLRTPRPDLAWGSLGAGYDAWSGSGALTAGLIGLGAGFDDGMQVIGLGAEAQLAPLLEQSRLATATAAALPGAGFSLLWIQAGSAPADDRNGRLAALADLQRGGTLAQLAGVLGGVTPPAGSALPADAFLRAAARPQAPPPAPTATAGPSVTPSPSPTVTPTAPPTATATAAPTATASPTATVAPGSTPTPRPVGTATPTPTRTATPTATATPTRTPQPTATPTPQPTPTAIPTPTPQPTPAPSPEAGQARLEVLLPGELGCGAMIISGVVWDERGQPANRLEVRIRGSASRDVTTSGAGNFAVYLAASPATGSYDVSAWNGSARVTPSITVTTNDQTRCRTFGATIGTATQGR